MIFLDHVAIDDGEKEGQEGAERDWVSHVEYEVTSLYLQKTILFDGRFGKRKEEDMP